MGCSSISSILTRFSIDNFHLFRSGGDIQTFHLKSSNFSKHGIENLVVVNEGDFNKSHLNKFNLSSISILKKKKT